MQVNEKAKKLLNEAGIKVETSSLYCVQLAKWGYEKGGIEAEDSVSETIEAMLFWKPIRTANFFMLNTDKIDYMPHGWQEAQNPLALAQIIINDIEEKIHLHFPLYGSVE